MATDHASRWEEVVNRAEADLPLDEAALLIAAHARPALDVDGELRRLDELGVEAREAGGDTEGAIEVLFGRRRLAGNTSAYEDPQNSYLDRVLDRGLGIPISLSVLLIEVGRRAGAHLDGIGLPGHFVARDRRDQDHLVDAFERGRRLDEDATRARFAPTGLSTFAPALFPVSTKAGILARMLANLDRSFRRLQDAAGLLWVTRLRVGLPDGSVTVLVEAAHTFEELGRYDEAAVLLDRVAATDTLPEDARVRVRQQAARTRARLN